MLKSNKKFLNKKEAIDAAIDAGAILTLVKFLFMFMKELLEFIDYVSERRKQNKLKKDGEK